MTFHGILAFIVESEFTGIFRFPRLFFIVKAAIPNTCEHPELLLLTLS
jgi:hypothetical protein